MKLWLSNVLIALAISMPLHATRPDNAKLEAGLDAMVDEDAHIAAIAFRLTTNAGTLCPSPGYQLGWVLQARDQYAPWLRDSAVRHFRLDDHIAVSAIVTGSPAAQAGIEVGDKLLAIDDDALPQAPAGGGGSYATVGAAVAAIDARLASGNVTFTVERGGQAKTVAVTPMRGCPVHVQLWPSSLLNAFADDRYATMTTALVRAADNDEDLAVLIGHEIAHAALHHEAFLNANAPARRVNGPSAAPAALVLQTEREADRLGLYLAARAGFDISRAEGLWIKLRKMRGPALWITKTHPSARERERALAATIEEIGQKRAAGDAP